jgi:5-hydroxyisourate hydrolase-like protein (transthyretin family)
MTSFSRSVQPEPTIVSITVTVIDGVSGHPADGVEVTVVGGLAGEQTRRMGGFTDPQGNFIYAPEGGSLVKGECYTVELDIDRYYASLGIVAGYKQVTILVRVVNTQEDYRMGMLITPFAHATWSVRLSRVDRR